MTSVAAIPPSAFYSENPEEGRRLVRFAFCKRMETLERAAARLGVSRVTLWKRMKKHGVSWPPGE